jgi:hypothetical protein
VVANGNNSDRGVFLEQFQLAKEITMLHRLPKRAAKEGESLRKATIWRRFAFAWITLGLFLFSLAGHWLFGWFAYASDQAQHGAPIDVGEYAIELSRDMLENWQSEFLQLLWQVGGLAFFLFIGSTQSNEGQHRLEEKLDAVLRAVDPERADRVISTIDDRYDRES